MTRPPATVRLPFQQRSATTRPLHLLRADAYAVALATIEAVGGRLEDTRLRESLMTSPEVRLIQQRVDSMGVNPAPLGRAGQALPARTH